MSVARQLLTVIQSKVCTRNAGTGIATAVIHSEEFEVMMKRNSVLIAALLLVALTVACGSLNRVTPAEWDKAAIEADVRSKVAGAVPGKTFDIGVSVSDSRVVTLTGSVDSSSDRTAIGNAAQGVNGVDRVINNISVR